MVGKKERFTLTEKIFRQINSKEISLVKKLLSRIFANLRNFHTDDNDHTFTTLDKYFVKLIRITQIHDFNVDSLKVAFKSKHTLAMPNHS